MGDKGVLAVPVDYGDDGADGNGVLKIDWAAIEAANAGVHLPDETDEHYTRRILFSRVGRAYDFHCSDALGFFFTEYIVALLESPLDCFSRVPGMKAPEKCPEACSWECLQCSRNVPGNAHGMFLKKCFGEFTWNIFER